MNVFASLDATGIQNTTRFALFLIDESGVKQTPMLILAVCIVPGPGGLDEQGSAQPHEQDARNHECCHQPLVAAVQDARNAHEYESKKGDGPNLDMIVASHNHAVFNI